MKRTIMASGVTALVLGLSAQAIAADAPSWDYVSAELVASGDFKVDSEKEDINGYRLAVAKGFGDFAFVRAGANAYHADFSGLKFDFGTQYLGVGARYMLPVGNMGIDLWGSLNYERVTIEGIVGTGPGIDLGARAQITPEFDLGLTWKIYGDVDFDVEDADYTGYELNAAYTVVPGVAITGSFSNYELDFGGGFKLEYENVIGLGVRLNY
jgi:hypothetical protein